MKKNFTSTIVAALVAVGAIVSSCSKDEETGPIEDVIIGQWVYDTYGADTEAVRRQLAEIMSYDHWDSIPDYFVGYVTEFTADYNVIKHNDGGPDENAGSYSIESDTLRISYSGNEGFPFSEAKIWANSNNSITMSVPIPSFVDVETLITDILIPMNTDHKELRAKYLREGILTVTFKRYGAE